MRELLALVGPTAVGKSGVAIGIAASSSVAVEVVNADAMQLYRGLDIGTAKVDVRVRSAVPHHLLDLWPVQHRASVVEYAAAARGAVDAIIGRHRWPIVVGGSGLYLTAALDVLQVPPTDPVIRARYERRLAELGPAELHDELAARDPAAAAAIDPANGRRIVRALEVVELTGSFAATLPGDRRSWRPTRWIGLRAPLSMLDARIEARVRGMWEAGLPAEVAALIGEGLRDGPTAAKAVGYQECLEYLDGGIGAEEAMARTARRTRQLARRQLRWFRRDPRISWVDLEPGSTDSEVSQRVLARFADRQPDLP